MISNKHQLFNRVVDSLDVRVNSALPPSGRFQQNLPLWSKFIQASQNESFDIDPHREFIPNLGPFTLLAYGKKPYKYVITNPTICDIRIWNPSKWGQACKGKTGQLYINFRSQFLQYRGLEGVRSALDAICEYFYGLEYFASQDDQAFIRVSRIDLAVDVSHPGFSWNSLDTFVSRARYRDTIASHSSADSALSSIAYLEQNVASSPLEDNKGGATYTISDYQLKLIRKALNKTASTDVDLSRCIHDRAPQTIYFGKFGGALYARLYNKSASLDKQQKTYMRDIWSANGWDGSTDVWRTEFSISGDFLKKCGDVLQSDRDQATGEIKPDLRDFELVANAIDALWTYCTSQWLRQIEPDSEFDTNKWRGQNTEFWGIVSSAYSVQDSLFRSQPARNPDDEQLEQQFAGVAKSLIALRMRSDDDCDPQYFLLEQVANWFESDSYLEELKERRVDLGVDDYSSDTLYSARVRRDAMALGLGS